MSADFGAIELLYPDAFPDEDLLPLIRDLMPDTAVATSIVGEIDSRIVAHVIFTKCGVTGERLNAALLGPLVVTVARQGQRIRESCRCLYSGDNRPYGFHSASTG